MKKYTGILFVLMLVGIPFVSRAEDLGDVDPNGNSTVTCASISQNLHYGSHDTGDLLDVYTLQDFLNTNKYLTASPNGFFGKATFNAVKAFQSANKLSPTGYVGPLTIAKIKAIDCGTSDVITSSPTISLSAPIQDSTATASSFVSMYSEMPKVPTYNPYNPKINTASPTSGVVADSSTGNNNQQMLSYYQKYNTGGLPTKDVSNVASQTNTPSPIKTQSSAPVVVNIQPELDKMGGASGVVTNVSGNTISVTLSASGKQIYTVDISRAKLDFVWTAGATPNYSYIAVGDMINVAGRSDGTNINASFFKDSSVSGRNLRGGKVTNVTGNVITMKGNDGNEYTVMVSSDTVYPGQQGAAVDDIIYVFGQINGKTIYAKGIQNDGTVSNRG